MRGVLISIAKILGFFGVWAALIAIVVMSAVTIGGVGWFHNVNWRLFVEIGGTIATLGALVFMVRVVDKRGWATLGFGADNSLVGLLSGTVLGAFIFIVPIGVLTALGYVRYAPDLGGFNANALWLALVLCFFNVITQEVLVRSYIFQELWTKYGVLVAHAVTTLLFVALHAGAIREGQNGLIAAANIALASVMLGLAYVRSGALWLPIGIHLGWNGLQGPVLGLSVTGQDIGLGYWRVFEFEGPPLLTGGAMGVEGGLIGLVGPALGLAIVAFAVRPKPAQ